MRVYFRNIGSLKECMECMIGLHNKGAINKNKNEKMMQINLMEKYENVVIVATFKISWRIISVNPLP